MNLRRENMELVLIPIYMAVVFFAIVAFLVKRAEKREKP